MRDTAILIEKDAEKAYLRRWVKHYSGLLETKNVYSADGVHWHRSKVGAFARLIGYREAVILLRRDNPKGEAAANDLIAAFCHRFGGLCPMCHSSATPDSACI